MPLFLIGSKYTKYKYYWPTCRIDIYILYKVEDSTSGLWRKLVQKVQKLSGHFGNLKVLVKTKVLSDYSPNRVVRCH